MSYDEESVAHVIIGSATHGDMLIIHESRVDFGASHYRCILRDGAPGGYGASIEDAILNFASRLEALAAEARAKHKVRHCPVCGRLKNQIRDRFCESGTSCSTERKP